MVSRNVTACVTENRITTMKVHLTLDEVECMRVL